MGVRLYQALFPLPIRSLFERSLERTRAEGAGLRIKLFLNPRDPVVRVLQGFPWELLFREDTKEFLSLSKWTPVVRCLPVRQPPRQLELPSRVRVLAALASPRDAAALALQRELTEITSADSRGRFEILPWKARLDDFRRTLREQGPFHVLHFLGHADFLKGREEGVLLFEAANGSRQEVLGASLAETLRDSHMQLLVLNACRTGQSSLIPSGNPFGGVAAALVQAGFPAVLAMQEAIPDELAIEFSRAFYQQLAQRRPLETALVEARQAVFSRNPEGFPWSIPVLFLRSASFDGPERPPMTDEITLAGINLFQNASYVLARQRFTEALKRDPGNERARLFDTLARIAAGHPLPVRAVGEVDAVLQELLRAIDSEVASLARVALGILRFDIVVPRCLRVNGKDSRSLFVELENSQRTQMERDVARAVGASRDAMRVFNLNL